MQPHNPLKESHSTFCLQRHPVTAHAILTVWGKLWGPRHECLTLTAQFSPAASCQHLHLITWRVLPVSRACSTSERGRWSAGKYSPPTPSKGIYTPAPQSLAGLVWPLRPQQVKAPDAQSANLFHDGCFPSDSSNNVAWDHLPNKSLPFEFLSDYLLQEKLKLRQIAKALSGNQFRTKKHNVKLLSSLRIHSELPANFTLILENDLKC